ncbi:MAG: serine/threonine protein kinase [Candidatus Brocadiae bacterium]|nr:serine/threonine protein kinase [Candidatus Brocadiia bacterium]
MNPEEEKEFAKFLVKKQALTLQNYKACLEAQHGLKKWGIAKTLDKVIVEKNFLTEKQIGELLTEYKGGDEGLIPNYRIIKKLGEGAMGEVYSAIDLNNDNRPVAIKILDPHLGKNKATAKRFLQEARLCIEKLNHQHIVKGYEVGYEAERDFFFYVMELIEGGNLRTVLKEKGIFSEPLALKILLQMSYALEHAYQFNLIHRDIKPDNIMLTKLGDAKLCDLGLARNWEDQDLSLTRTGTVMGTPFYISPEAADGLKLDNRSDIYSLGATIYHTVVGHVPFDGPNAGIVLNRHRKDPLVPPIELRLDISVGFSAIIEMMMAKSPKDRYQTPMALSDDIKKLQNGYAPQALLKLKESYGIVETIRKPKDSRASGTLEAVLVSDTEEFGYSKALETVKVKEDFISGIKRHDTVEEYRLDDQDPSNFDSFIHINPYKKKKPILAPFFTSAEHRMLEKTHAKSKLLAIGAAMVCVILLLLIAVVFLVLKIIQN